MDRNELPHEKSDGSQQSCITLVKNLFLKIIKAANFSFINTLIDCKFVPAAVIAGLKF